MMWSWLFEPLFWLCSISAILVGYLSVSNFNHWKKRNIPYVTPIPFFGNCLKFFLKQENFGQFFDSIYYKFENEPVVGFFLTKEPCLLVRDPNLVNDILVKHFTSFYNRGIVVHNHKEINPLSEQIFSADDEKWHKLRAKLSPAFTNSKLKLMYEQMEECTHSLLQLMDNKLERSENLEIRELCGKFTIDVIGTCAFGLDCQSIKDSDSDFYKHGQRIFEPRVRQFLRMVLMGINPKLLNIIRIPEIPRMFTDFYLSVIEDSSKYRKENNVRRNDIFQMLLDYKNADYNPKDYTFFGEPKSPSSEDNFDELDVAANAFIFLIAGVETTASTISFCLYELSIQPDIQKKVREEINRVKEKYEGKITVDSLKELTYLDMTIAETLRMYPPSPTLFRICTRQYYNPDENTIIQKGDRLVISVCSVHYDPKYYPEPNKFDPDRFSNENKKTRPAGTYIPFGDGPRICLGMRFAQLEMKLSLSELLSKYEFSTCSKTQIPLIMEKGSFFLRPTNGIWLKVNRV